MFVVAHPNIWRIAGLIVAGAITLNGTGCSPPPGSVTGKVAIAGKALASGQISFVAKSGTPYTFNIDADGYYKADGLPPGEMTVLVFGQRLSSGKAATEKKRGMAKHSAPAPAPDAPIVPAKFSDVTTSDLKYTVTSGAATWDPPLN